MSIDVTESAARQIQKQLQKRGSGLGLRLGVKTSGCSGYAYVLDAVEAPAAEDLAMNVGDGVTVFVDPASLPMINGMEVDYVKEGLNRTIQFRNPNVTGQCGCGESFTVK